MVKKIGRLFLPLPVPVNRAGVTAEAFCWVAGVPNGSKSAERRSYTKGIEQFPSKVTVCNRQPKPAERLWGEGGAR